MTCGNCGRQNNTSAHYCLDCGQKLRDPAAPLQAAASALGQLAVSIHPGPEALASGAHLAAPVQNSCPRCHAQTPNDRGGDAASAAAVAFLVTILKDGSEGPVYKISGATTDIGRAEGNILFQDDPYLSPRHARISIRGGRYYLCD
jgi:hypothetical protein